MVDLGGYVIILVETHDKKVKLYGKQIILTFILCELNNSSQIHRYEKEFVYIDCMWMSTNFKQPKVGCLRTVFNANDWFYSFFGNIKKLF